MSGSTSGALRRSDFLHPLRYRAGFEDWDDPGAFVVQLEEAMGYDDGRTAVHWHPVARFDHERPHDVFDPAEGLHLDLYRRGTPDEYETVDLGVRFAEREPLAALSRLTLSLEHPENRELLAAYYRGERTRFPPGAFALPPTGL